MKDFFVNSWKKFRAWKYCTLTTWTVGSLAVIAVASILVLSITASKSKVSTPKPSGGTSADSTTTEPGDSVDSGTPDNGTTDNGTTDSGTTEPGTTEPDTTAPTVDPDNVNNATGNTTTDKESKLSFYKTSTHSAATTVSPGKTVTYSLVVTNEGSDSKAVTVTDEIPAVAEYVSGCDKVSGNQMKWELTLGAKESKTITYTLRTKNDEANLGKALDGTKE